MVRARRSILGIRQEIVFPAKYYNDHNGTETWLYIVHIFSVVSVL